MMWKKLAIKLLNKERKNIRNGSSLVLYRQKLKFIKKDLCNIFNLVFFKIYLKFIEKSSNIDF